MAKKKTTEKLGTAKKVVILALLVVLTAVVYYMFFYRARSAELARLHSENASLVKQEQDWEKRQKTYIQDVEDLNRRKERQLEQIRILPPDAEMSSFLMDLDNLAGLAGLEIELLEPADEEAAGFYAKIPVTLRLKGKFHQVLKFFHSVGKLERIINIENIQFGGVKAAGTEVEITAEVQATTFRSLENRSELAPVAQGGG